MRTVFAVFLVMLAARVAFATPLATIELLPVAVVAGDAVVLGQVAHLRSTDLVLMRKLVDLPVGRAPRAGQEAVVDRAALQRWIQRERSVPQDLLEWHGSDETRIVRNSTRVRAEDIAEAATRAVAHALSSRGTAGEIRVPFMPRDLDLPGSQPRLQARVPAEARLRGRTLVWVDLWAGPVFVRSVAVAVEILPNPDGGNAMQPGAPTGGFGSSREASRSADAPLAVSRGEWATLQATAGLVALESRVEVLQDGRAGDKVRVRQNGATGVVFARVVGPGQLELAP